MQGMMTLVRVVEPDLYDEIQTLEKIEQKREERS